MGGVKRRDFLKAVGVGAASLALPGRTAGAGAAGPPEKPRKKRPNLLIIHTDQQSCWTIGAYGGDLVQTPHIDDCRFMYNRGHWKSIVEKEGAPTGSTKIGDEKTYTTDRLAARTIDFVSKERERPFFFMLSIPDPHTPFSVRAPYDTRYDAAKMPVPHTFDHGEYMGEHGLFGKNNLYDAPDHAKTVAELTQRIISHNRKVEAPAARWLKSIEGNRK